MQGGQGAGGDSGGHETRLAQQSRRKNDTIKSDMCTTLNRIAGVYLYSKTRHLHPQTVCKSLQASLGHTVGTHVQACEEGEDAGGVNHPTCREAQTQLKARQATQQLEAAGIWTDLCWLGLMAERLTWF